MGDIKDCGLIEQESDIVITMYRDEYYNPDTSEKGVAEFSIEKNRHGPTETIKTYFNAETMTFTDSPQNMRKCTP